MKIYLYSLFWLSLISCVNANKSINLSEIQKFQSELNSEYLNPEETPLRIINFDDFTVHPFFPIDLKYRIVADFKKLENAKKFEFPTSSGKTKTYIAFGKASFNLNGEWRTLTIYQSQNLIKKEKYRNHLFLPFKDLTNTRETYGGGKYIDLRIPDSDKILIDFNQSYQPYCAYNPYHYSCPIVPPENFLNTRIEAGVQNLDSYFEH